ncbi:hypothetical protein B0H13DRAFT_810218 [Mycena leptocephala]|nr:hypothetical protein B0H13DRAFT_810218 [Mycena leptocephala]
MWGFLSDLTGSRFTWVFVPLAYGLIPNGILAVWPPSIKLKEFAFLTGGVQLMTAVFYTWANEVCKADNEGLLKIHFLFGNRLQLGTSQNAPWSCRA